MSSRIVRGLLVIGLCVCLGAWFFSGPRDIRFVFPPSFDGPFIVVLDERGGDLKEVDGIFVVTVGSTRIARVRSFKPFQAWHNESWITVDNRKTVHQADFVAPEQQITLRPIGLESCGNSYQRIKYFLGSLGDAEAFDFCSIHVPRMRERP